MIINAIAVTPRVAEGWISSLCDLSDPRAIYIRTEMDRLRALASGDALDEGKNTIARTIAGKLMRAGLLNEPHAPEPPDDLMDQIMAIVVTALAAPSPLAGTPPSEAGGGAELDNLKADNLRLVNDLEAEGVRLGQLRAELQKAEKSIEFYKERFDLLQKWQVNLLDPVRTEICNIMANARVYPDNRRSAFAPISHPVAAASTGEGAK